MTAPPMPNAQADPDSRRAALAVQANPAERLDYRITLSRPVRVVGAGALSATVDYVPDRVVLVPASLTRYLTGLEGLPWPGPEALGAAILDDINNEAVPRWLRVTVSTRSGPADSDEAVALWHAVVLEDRQPHWHPPAGSAIAAPAGPAPAPWG
ncbi:hypothetical protein [Rhodospira trueperi]|uniref:Uncharacterized protein n=1 Tax=Rhodospira trueperi TaxID=69960 RepID=A0A1G7C2A0_9PROT|nr:hypothetical protein [Rhodospira trueperi]SDE32890.1 hypothetical protein SAMN05421720_105251 [Rhodospira trueperi]